MINVISLLKTDQNLFDYLKAGLLYKLSHFKDDANKIKSIFVTKFDLKTSLGQADKNSPELLSADKPAS